MKGKSFLYILVCGLAGGIIGWPFAGLTSSCAVAILFSVAALGTEIVSLLRDILDTLRKQDQTKP